MKLIPSSLLKIAAALLSIAAFTPFAATSIQAQEQQLVAFRPQFNLQVAHVRNVRTTAYTHDEASHTKWAKHTASGGQLTATQRYTSAAADWSRFPVGTVFRVIGEPTVYVVDD
ncbi:MAG: 3D (Asp-Asp-Asp) domain-containing protein [Verrucomicrobiales bacterium]|jgi:3D (Asp-Asp-Asp) domain-containing protein